MTKVSIIIPCYNVAHYVGECLKHIQEQTLKDIEIICIDDKSTDDTLKVLNEYASKDIRIKVIAKDRNEGAGKSRNIGIDAATGDYIVFMDPDDYYPEEKTLEKLYNAVTQNNVSIAGGNVEGITPEGKKLKLWSGFEKSQLCDYKENPFHYGYWRFIYKRNFILKNKLCFPDYLRYQDPPFFVKAMAIAQQYYVISDVVYVYRINYKNVIWTERKALDVLSGVSDVLELCATYQLDKLYISQVKDFLSEEFANIYEQVSSFESAKTRFLDILMNIDCKVLTKELDAKIDCKECYCELIKRDKILYKKWKKYINWPSLLSKIYCKKKYPNGRRCIYLFNKKIFSYRRSIVSKKWKYIHIMWNDKFNKPFVDFLNKKFNPEEHLVLCKRVFQQFPFPEGNNVIEIPDLKGLKLHKGQKLICHSLFDDEVVRWLYKHRSELKKQAYWVIWGGDLYNAPRDKINDYVRKNFKGYLTDFDRKFAEEKYSLKRKPFFCIHAIFPITKEMIENSKSIKRDHIQIQINNSADKSTLEILDTLSKFKDENIKITTILSYGQTTCKDEIIEKGKNIYGDKFEYIEKYMYPREYARYLAQNDILILNQNRQQGVGNTVVSLAMGKKVFIRSEISTYKKIKEFNIEIFDTNQISNMTFEEFKQNDNYKISQTNAMKFFDDDYKASLWEKVFDA